MLLLIDNTKRGRGATAAKGDSNGKGDSAKGDKGDGSSAKGDGKGNGGSAKGDEKGNGKVNFPMIGVTYIHTHSYA